MREIKFRGKTLYHESKWIYGDRIVCGDRTFIGIEISKEYIKIAEKRLAQGVFDF